MIWRFEEICSIICYHIYSFLLHCKSIYYNDDNIISCICVFLKDRCSLTILSTVTHRPIRLLRIWINHVTQWYVYYGADLMISYKQSMAVNRHVDDSQVGAHRWVSEPLHASSHGSIAEPNSSITTPARCYSRRALTTLSLPTIIPHHMKPVRQQVPYFTQQHPS